ncbi:MAG: thiopurine S-methyltransferase [SAR324 cluster bacterium]|nr:thiopurine S-methyltransferase [SAR324 cluster bacterium]
MDKNNDHEEWEARWNEDRIGFHISRPNPFLLRYWEHLEEVHPSRCFLPLCGKSVDLVWISERVGTVVGVELVEKAVQDFFREQQIVPEIRETPPFQTFSHGGLKILLGDFFDLASGTEEPFQAVFDRASLVAIPEHLRIDYAQCLMKQMVKGGRLLLICVDYDTSKMKGPPYSVTQTEVERLFSSSGKLELLESRDNLEDRLRERGLEWLTESVYLFEKN